MSQEERQMTSGEVLKEASVTWDGDGTPDGQPGPLNWHNIPYAPPFQPTLGAGYPQLYQIPWSYFPAFPHRPEGNEVTTESDTDEDSTRQYSWGNPYHYFPYHHHPYHLPFHHDWYYHYPYYHHYYHHYPHHDYHYPRPPYYRVEQSTEKAESGTESNTATAPLTSQEETRQLFPFIGISPFGPSFGFGFGAFGPFYPRPFYPRPFFPYPYHYRPFFW